MEISCAICLESFGTSCDIAAIPCGHVFHEACIKKWQGAQKNCAQCRQMCRAEEILRLYVSENESALKGNNVRAEYEEKILKLEKEIHNLEFDKLKLGDNSELSLENLRLKAENLRLEQEVRKYLLDSCSPSRSRPLDRVRSRTLSESSCSSSHASSRSSSRSPSPSCSSSGPTLKKPKSSCSSSRSSSRSPSRSSSRSFSRSSSHSRSPSHFRSRSHSRSPSRSPSHFRSPSGSHSPSCSSSGSTLKKPKSDFGKDNDDKLKLRDNSKLSLENLKLKTECLRLERENCKLQSSEVILKKTNLEVQEDNIKLSKKLQDLKFHERKVHDMLRCAINAANLTLVRMKLDLDTKIEETKEAKREIIAIKVKSLNLVPSDQIQRKNNKQKPEIAGQIQSKSATIKLPPQKKRKQPNAESNDRAVKRSENLGLPVVIKWA